MHPKPVCIGHCLMFPKQRCARLQDSDPDHLGACGMLLPKIKRALRMATGYRCYGILMHSGEIAGQDVQQLHFDIMPTSKVKQSFRIDWDPKKEGEAGNQDRRLRTKAAEMIIRGLRSAMGLAHLTGWGSLVYETDKILCELVQIPVAVGHCIISPKTLSPDLEDCSIEDCGACTWMLPKLAKAFEISTGRKDFFVSVLNGPDAGQNFPHLTFQLVPFSPRNQKPVEVYTMSSVTYKAHQISQLQSAIRHVMSEDIISNALHVAATPMESSWSQAPLHPVVNRAGISSPFVDRARSQHPNLEAWAGKTPSRQEQRAPANKGLGVRTTTFSAAGQSIIGGDDRLRALTLGRTF